MSYYPCFGSKVSDLISWSFLLLRATTCCSREYIEPSSHWLWLFKRYLSQFYCVACIILQLQLWMGGLVWILWWAFWPEAYILIFHDIDIFFLCPRAKLVFLKPSLQYIMWTHSWYNCVSHKREEQTQKCVRHPTSISHCRTIIHHYDAECTRAGET